MKDQQGGAPAKPQSSPPTPGSWSERAGRTWVPPGRPPPSSGENKISGVPSPRLQNEPWVNPKQDRTPVLCKLPSARRPGKTPPQPLPPPFLSFALWSEPSREGQRWRECSRWPLHCPPGQKQNTTTNPGRFPFSPQGNNEEEPHATSDGSSPETE